MRELNTVGIEVVRLFLEKIEILTDEERKTIIQTIQLINKPIFVV